MNTQEAAKLRAYLGKLAAENREIKRQLAEQRAQYAAFIKACENVPSSPTEELDSIPGRRIFYGLSDEQTFTTDLDGQRGQPMNFLVSQDGPFVMSHFPLVTWRPSAPDTATRFGQWRPVASWPLPDQVVDDDRIDLSWEFVSGGSQRNFQNEPWGPIFSRPDNLVPLPIPTLFAPNETIQMILTYEDINFSTGDTPTTEGTVRVTLPGYRAANM